MLQLPTLVRRNPLPNSSGQQQIELDFFRQALRRVKEASRPSTGPGVTGPTRSGDDDAPAARRADDRADVRAGRRQSGRLLPALGGVRPATEETGVRDAIQRLALTHRHYGYRPISAQLRREGFAVNGKRVLRLMREDNLL
ncbi:IS3 family transposase [Bradyrhizobium sp. CCBAU 11361]|uniref:IS3 family transposase n=1 Tax=Bradyrhizobium sp. CCBAU 11361 TaxID=1630812 RepID=UPI0023035837|nr:IS3 family transposase [Bradyrhizobium sp. CCBAU 11361]